ncbi:MAG: nuclear transport factor 2 family protein [Gammaproteobacteria bacterium]|nr:nuclear transport factor 2 family protein [Gammaproteobacteria bacterium]MBI5616812.1 nuclear transport factor 2 family protein [Gammaproteobacteria bacterium]
MSDIRAKPTNEAQRALLALVGNWQQTYNEDVARMIHDCYAPDAHVRFTGGEARGHEQFMRVEQAVLRGCPGRYMRVDRVLFAGDDVAIVEAVVLDRARPDFLSPFCAILSVRDGKIVSDHTYLEPERWPGIAEAAPHVSPGGLGRA